MSFGRRAILRGIGGTVLGLPLLESLAGAQAAPKRFAILWEVNGVCMRDFWPATPYGALTDASFAPGRAIAPLKDYKDRLLIPRGLDFVGATGHSGTLALTSMVPVNREVPNGAQAAGPSVDWVMAKQVNPDGRAPLALRVVTLDSKIPYRASVSHRGLRDAYFGEKNPWSAYQNLIGLGATADNPATRLLIDRRKSVLDLVRGRVELLRNQRLSQLDKQKLDMHFNAVRELERGLDVTGLKTLQLPPERRAEMQALKQNSDGNYGNSLFPTLSRMHLDILALAFASDLNRVATCSFGIEVVGPTYSFDGMAHRFNHHALSHGTENQQVDGVPIANYLDLLAEIDRWHATQMKYLLDKLSAYKEGAGSVLDSTTVVWMNSMGDGKKHKSEDTPVVMAGSLGGSFKMGRYLDLRDPDGKRKPHNMLLTTFLNAMGIPEKHFGAKDIGRDGPLDALRG